MKKNTYTIFKSPEETTSKSVMEMVGAVRFVFEGETFDCTCGVNSNDFNDLPELNKFSVDTLDIKRLRADRMDIFQCPNCKKLYTRRMITGDNSLWNKTIIVEGQDALAVVSL